MVMTILYAIQDCKSKIKKSICGTTEKVLKSIHNKLLHLTEKKYFNVRLTFIFIVWICFCSISLYAISLFISTKDILHSSSLLTSYQIVGTIFISLFIFIAAEGMRDRDNKYKLKILLKESALPTIIILFLFSIILLISNNTIYCFRCTHRFYFPRCIYCF